MKKLKGPSFPFSTGAFYSGKDYVYLQVKTVIKNFLLTVTK